MILYASSHLTSNGLHLCVCVVTVIAATIT